MLSSCRVLFSNSEEALRLPSCFAPCPDHMKENDALGSPGYFPEHNGLPSDIVGASDKSERLLRQSLCSAAPLPARTPPGECFASSQGSGWFPKLAGGAPL